MSRCPACAGVEGAAHSCPESGTFVAAEAHVAGAVEEQAAADWPRFQVSIAFRARASDEQTLRERFTGLVGGLLDDDLVEGAEVSVIPWEASIA